MGVKMITHEMKVECLNTMGTDLDIVNAARASFNKQSEYDYVVNQDKAIDEDGNLCWLRQLSMQPRLKEKDRKLLRYLAKHEHWTPFAQVNLQFRFYIPIFVARQLMRHNVGVVWNERSRRYVSDAIEFYVPKEWRSAPENKKQGSGDERFRLDSEQEMMVMDAIYSSHRAYEMLLETNVAPEMARMLLPQNLMTSIVGNGTLFFWARVCRLRLDPHAQEETRWVAERISNWCEYYFPEAWEELKEHYINA